MASQDGDNPGGDPLLVRPFLRSDEDFGVDGSPGAVWPADGDATYREIRSHRVTAAHPAPERTAPATRRRRGTYALAGAGVAAAIGLAAVGYGLVRPAPDGDELPIPSGALPPLPSAAVSPGPDTAAADLPPAATATRPGAAATPGSRPASGPPSAPPSASAAAGTTGTPSPSAGPPGGQLALKPPPAAADAPVPAAPPTAARVGRIAGDGNLCLDLNGGVPVDDNHVQVFGCNNSPAQRWTLAPDGTLQVVGKCAQIVGDATVHIVSCDGRTTAQWRAAGDGALVNLANGQCLTDPDSGTREGAAVRVSPCEDADNQRWALP